MLSIDHSSCENPIHSSSPMPLSYGRSLSQQMGPLEALKKLPRAQLMHLGCGMLCALIACSEPASNGMQHHDLEVFGPLLCFDSSGEACRALLRCRAYLDLFEVFDCHRDRLNGLGHVV